MNPRIYIAFLLAGLAPYTGKAQHNKSPHIHIPGPGGNTPLSIEVFSFEHTVQFANDVDYHGSKMTPGYFHIKVRSSVPWIVTATLAGQNSTGGSSTNPDKLSIRLRSAITGNGILLSNTPQVILESNNNLTENEYSVDLIVDPPFDLPQGDFRGTVNFQVAAQ